MQNKSITVNKDAITIFDGKDNHVVNSDLLKTYYDRRCNLTRQFWSKPVMDGFKSQSEKRYNGTYTNGTQFITFEKRQDDFYIKGMNKNNKVVETKISDKKSITILKKMDLDSKDNGMFGSNNRELQYIANKHNMSVKRSPDSFTELIMQGESLKKKNNSMHYLMTDNYCIKGAYPNKNPVETLISDVFKNSEDANDFSKQVMEKLPSVLKKAQNNSQLNGYTLKDSNKNVSKNKHKIKKYPQPKIKDDSSKFLFNEPGDVDKFYATHRWKDNKDETKKISTDTSEHLDEKVIYYSGKKNSYKLMEKDEIKEQDDNTFSRREQILADSILAKNLNRFFSNNPNKQNASTDEFNKMADEAATNIIKSRP